MGIWQYRDVPAKNLHKMKTQTTTAFKIAAILLGSYLTLVIVNALINLL